jgi:hypothetical protein
MRRREEKEGSGREEEGEGGGRGPTDQTKRTTETTPLSRIGRLFFKNNYLPLEGKRRRKTEKGG